MKKDTKPIRKKRKKDPIQKVEEHNQHIEDLMEKEASFFQKVSTHIFKAHMKRAYWGTPPFTKTNSYAEFKRLNRSGFLEILYANRFLSLWARNDTDLQGIKPTKQDQVIAYKLLCELKEEAERVKCDCCNGTGFKKKI